MIQELILLGLLMEGPRHGYEIKKEIERRLSQFIDLPTKAIYYTLQKLSKEDLVTRTIGQWGRRPERFVYHITDKGREEFKKLLIKNLFETQRPFLNLDLSLYFMKYLDLSEAAEKLRDRLRNLREVRYWAYSLDKHFKRDNSSFHLMLIARHMKETIQPEIQFTEELIRLFEKMANLSEDSVIEKCEGQCSSISY